MGNFLAARVFLFKFSMQTFFFGKISRTNYFSRAKQFGRSIHDPFSYFLFPIYFSFVLLPLTPHNFSSYNRESLKGLIETLINKRLTRKSETEILTDVAFVAHPYIPCTI